MPQARYAIVGATHPEIRRRVGEAYRGELAEQATRLGLDGRILFVDRYVDDAELATWLSASDIFVTPYANAQQITSGTLAYAVAAGAAEGAGVALARDAKLGPRVHARRNHDASHRARPAHASPPAGGAGLGHSLPGPVARGTALGARRRLAQPDQPGSAAVTTAHRDGPGGGPGGAAGLAVRQPLHAQVNGDPGDSLLEGERHRALQVLPPAAPPAGLPTGPHRPSATGHPPVSVVERRADDR